MQTPVFILDMALASIILTVARTNTNTDIVQTQEILMSHVAVHLRPVPEPCGSPAAQGEGGADAAPDTLQGDSEASISISMSHIYLKYV